VDPDGRAVAGYRSPHGAGGGTIPINRPDHADGRFAFERVIPGSYEVRANRALRRRLENSRSGRRLPRAVNLTSARDGDAPRGAVFDRVEL
jgi:hypothetical protein